MKEYFSYISLIVLALFSFYYTKEVVNIIKDDDPIMMNIMAVESDYNRSCNEGYLEEDGIVLGYDGITVNRKDSYNNMKGFGFSKDLLVFETIPCMINKSKYLDKYILRGNDKKNAISLLIEINNFDDSLINLEKKQNIKLTYIVGDKEIKKYKEKIINNRLDIVYKGNDKNSLKEYKKIVKFNKNTPYCISDYLDNIDLCSKYKINTIKGSYHLENNVFSKGKMESKRGAFLVIKESKDNIDNLNVLINYIKNKGYNIYSITKHLD